MAYYEGVVQAKDLHSTLISHITAVQPGESEPWWMFEGSVSGDQVYTSTGSSGEERIVIILEEGVVGHYLRIGIAKDYTPGIINVPGTFEDLFKQDVRYHTSTSSEFAFITYHLSVTKDRIILHLQGDKSFSSWLNQVIFIGMPIRYDQNDKNCIAFTISEYNYANNKIKLIEDSLNQRLIDYDWYYTAAPTGSSWGNHTFAEPLHFGLNLEGLRGQLEGLYGAEGSNLADGNEVDINGIPHLVIHKKETGYNGFPRTCLLMTKE